MDNARVKEMRPITLFFVLTVLISVMLIAPAVAEETQPQSSRVYVNASYNDETPDYGYHNFSTIQKAVDNVKEGGEVWVYNGTYNESVVIDRSMTVTTVSELACPGLDGVTIDAMGAHTGVEITASGVSLSGFEVENASGVGIYARGADAIEIIHNHVSVLERIYAITCGILVEDGTGACIDGNEVHAIGSSGQWGVRVDGVTEACIHDNYIVAVSLHQELTAAEVSHNPILAAFALEEDEPFLNGEEETSALAPGGVLVTRSNSVLVESNFIGAVGVCIPDEGDPHYAAVDALGIRSGGSESVKILTNDVMVVGVATNASRTVGIRATGDLALIQGNRVETYTESMVVQPVGIVLDRAS